MYHDTVQHICTSQTSRDRECKCILVTGQDSSVGIATRYGMDVPGIESRWGGENFRSRPDRPWGPPSLLHNGYRFFVGGNVVGEWRSPPSPSSAEVKERVQLYLYSSWLSWPVLR